MPIITSSPMRKPPTVAARTKALTPRAAPTCRTNYWLVVALPMRATGTLNLRSRRALVGGERELLTVMIDEGSLERLTVGVQRAVEGDRAFRSVDRHSDPLASEG